MVKRIRTVLVAAILGTMAFELTQQFLPPGANGFFAPTVEAVVGRPLTPVSISGVARLTSQRCSAGVYDC